MMKKIFQLIAILFAALMIPFMAEAAATPVVDGARLLSQQEAREITALIQQVNKKHNVEIGVVTQTDLRGAGVGQAANALIDRVYNHGQNGNMVLLIDMGTRSWYISTDNNMRQKITDDVGIKHISQQFTSKLSGGNYAEAFKAYVNAADEMLTYYETEGEAYDPSNAFSLGGLLGGGVLATLFGGGVKKYLVGTMSNVAPNKSVAHYLRKDSFEVTDQNDQYLYTNRIVTPIPRKTGGGGFSASNGSHGGGGGHF